MRRAGAITIGKTNTPEFGAGSQTFNTVFGATRNPYDLTKTCGGSSGGAAVALACGLVPVADGTDTGGSLRNPAAFCNVVGFRPSIGRVPDSEGIIRVVDAQHLRMPGAFCRGPGLRAEHDCRARSACAALYQRARSTLRAPARPQLQRRARGLVQRPGRSALRPACARRCRWTPRTRLNRWAASSEQAEPDFAPAEIAFRLLRAWNSANAYGARLREHPDAFKDTLKGEIEEGLRLTGMDVARAEIAHGQIWRRFQAFLEKYEYFVLPTTQVPPFDVNTPYPTEIAGVKLDNYIDWMKSCWYISATGNPAASVPAGFTPEGLPVGVQIVGRHKDDFAVLQLAHAFEQATGFGKKRPAIA